MVINAADGNNIYNFKYIKKNLVTNYKVLRRDRTTTTKTVLLY